MLASAGVRYAIIGHSERRQYHGETDELIREKIAACVAAGIRPVYCCGEGLELVVINIFDPTRLLTSQAAGVRLKQKYM